MESRLLKFFRVVKVVFLQLYPYSKVCIHSEDTRHDADFLVVPAIIAVLNMRVAYLISCDFCWVVAHPLDFEIMKSSL